MRFSIMLWGDYETSTRTYDLLFEVAKFADQNGFEAITIPERHFHTFGGHYPNPSVLSAAIAAVTKNIRIRANSVVAPFHDPIRIAEEWSVVDVLSGGRVELSLASGWQPDDFVMCPYDDGYARRKDLMWEIGEELKALWRGEKLQRINGHGNEVSVGTYPRPVQDELQLWATAAGNPSTFDDAGTRNYHVLTALLAQTLEEVGENVARYRASCSENSYVALMLHSFVDATEEGATTKTRSAFRNFLWKAADLTLPLEIREQLNSVSPDVKDQMLDVAFERYYHTASLIGTVEHCQAMVDRAASAGVDEICCLIDFGVDEQCIVEALPYLGELKRRCT